MPIFDDIGLALAENSAVPPRKLLGSIRGMLSKHDLIPLGDLLSCAAICLPEPLC
jgi:hypothetical protein